MKNLIGNINMAVYLRECHLVTANQTFLMQNDKMRSKSISYTPIALAVILALGSTWSSSSRAQKTALGPAQMMVVADTSAKPINANTQNPGTAPANAEALDLLSLYREAAFNDPVFNAAKYGFMAGKEKRWQGLSVLLPQVVGTGNETKNDFYNQTRGIPSQDLMSRAWNVTLTQPLFNWDKWSQFRQGDMTASIAEAKFASAEQDLVIRVTEAYFNVLNTQDTLNLARNKKVLIGEQLEQAKRNFEVGTSTITDTHEAQSRYDLVVAQELAAEADLLIKRGALEQITGKQITQVKSLSNTSTIDTVAKDRKIKLKKGEKPTPVNVQQAVTVQPGQSISDWVKQAEDVSYNIIADKLAYEVAVKDTQRAYAGHAPSVDFIARRGYSDTEGAVGATDTPLSMTKSYSSQAIIQLTVPLFSGGYNQSVVREKSALANKALADLENTRRSVAQTTRQAYLGFNNGLAQVKAYEAAELSALSALESNKLGYEVGVRINIDVLNAQDTLFTTRRDLAKARYDTILNGLKLKAQAAVLSDEDLQAVNALLK
jgi:outer membrane protein